MKPGIYIHLPFCSVHCVYCDFPITTRTSLLKRYDAALLAEIERHPTNETADTLYFGGGTPSLTPPETLSRVLQNCNLEKTAEISLEANPDHISPSLVQQWLHLGINRLSLGIQSLEDTVLHKMLRQHTPEQAMKSLEMARKEGSENLNVDLILGFPHQTRIGFIEGLKRLIEFYPEHFSIYLLEIHERTPLARLMETDRLILMPEEEQLDCHQEAMELLRESGYEHYEISNFSIPGKASKHNLKYWTDQPYFAFGAGACSYDGHQRWKNVDNVSTYVELVERGESPAHELQKDTDETKARNALIFGLRKTSGIHVDEFTKDYGCTPKDLFGPAYEDHLSNGLLELSQNRLRLTPHGQMVSNEVLSSLV